MAISKSRTATPSATRATSPAIESALRTLEAEASGITALANALQSDLGPAFDAAVARIRDAKGRLIVTGLGKSGHIGKKMAASFASTGTPAFFVHPAEMSHGDLGMIVRGDIVLALSNSGEAKELNDLIEYTRRFAIPLIGITSRPQSTLATRADIALLLPPCPEACPNGLAPTTSTTLTMAMGDALAVTLLEKKGFTDKDFKVFHPGGKLGQQLLRVSEIMNEAPITNDDASFKDAVRVINEKGLGCVVLVDKAGVLSGLITDGDIRRNIENVPSAARDAATKNPQTIGPDMLVGEAMALMNGLKGGRKITSLIVADDAGKPVGLLHLHDCLRAGFA